MAILNTRTLCLSQTPDTHTVSLTYERHHQYVGAGQQQGPQPRQVVDEGVGVGDQEDGTHLQLQLSTRLQNLLGRDDTRPRQDHAGPTRWFQNRCVCVCVYLDLGLGLVCVPVCVPGSWVRVCVCVCVYLDLVPASLLLGQLAGERVAPRPQLADVVLARPAVLAVPLALLRRLLLLHDDVVALRTETAPGLNPRAGRRRVMGGMRRRGEERRGRQKERGRREGRGE